jgi:hypothetical protein
MKLSPISSSNCEEPAQRSYERFKLPVCARMFLHTVCDIQEKKIKIQ